MCGRRSTRIGGSRLAPGRSSLLRRGILVRHTVCSSRHSLLAGLVLAAISTILPAFPALSGFTVKIECIDPNGVKTSTLGTEAHYSFFRRTLLRKPEGPDGKTFRDDEVRLDAFSFQGHRVQFQHIREVRFEWRQEAAREFLVLDFELTTGERFERKGADLEGADHPLSPAVVLLAADGPMR